MQVESSEAVILRHLDYGEADRIVTFYTPDHGLLKGFARGARKSRKRFGTSLEPFAAVRLYWVPSRGEGLASLREAELLDLRTGLRADLEALALAAYGCELVEALFGAGQGHPEVFSLLSVFLDMLDRGGFPGQARLLFELRLLELAGYAPHLLHCSDCDEPLLADPVRFDPQRGGSLCRNCASPMGGVEVSLGTLGSLSRCLRAPLERLEELRLGGRTLDEGGRVVFSALLSHLPRPPRSLAFLEQLGNEIRPSGERRNPRVKGD